MTCRLARNAQQDRGAAAVEFALLLPVLLLLVFGIIDFGRALNAQITLTQAAREGARLAALGDPNVVSGAQSAATDLSPVSVTVATCPTGTTSGASCVTVTTCPAGAGAAGIDAVVQASYSFSFVTPIDGIAGIFGSSFGSTMTLTAQGVMRCET